VGTIPILIVAGLIEGFFSPSALPWQWKFSLASAIAVIFFSYLAFCARGGNTVAIKENAIELENVAAKAAGR